MLHPYFEIFDIRAHLALVDEALVFRKNKLDRILEREDVLAVVLVDVVEHRTDRGALAGARHAGQQNHPLVELAELLD